MKPSMKMGVIALVGVCVVFYQYHLSTGIRFDQAIDFSAGGSLDDEVESHQIKFPRFTTDMVMNAVRRVQDSNGLSPEVGTLLIKEIWYQLNKNVLENTENDSRILRPCSKLVTTNVACMPSLSSSSTKNEISLDPLYIITPTYRRPEQIPELTRMSHTLMLVKNIHWLVIEDAYVATKQVTRLLERTGLKFDHLTAPMPEKYKFRNGAKPRGVSNRNRGLQWIRANATKGVLYFADDDNTYDIALFDEIRKTKTVSMFPVGLCTKFGLSSPIIKNGTFAGFYDGWVAGRKFPVDMAGFAVNVKFLLQRPNATMPFRAGYEEDGFLKSLAPLEPRDVQLLADNCTRVLAWHTQTKKNEPSVPLNMKLYGSTNLVKLKEQIV
ncbi:galactosylgalactosylxylosylprotein 3-beta-glucuronosyltransferase P-like [Vespula pensylvanica]|uniref:galactosylgalactosylxylosylprotein 3-beta-glucuronosyltransferase P-like n=1 Tax=Vespula pensylvanica TaxID=30213 RepID=UPI001CB9DD57|nr:galactosylgalactosylxylosylprotein 3-beta-glucuronosyltransferase P-like [Vespula pensylvanica]XP_043671438.1 galactosylgalactosylxylosylprotein 3-beta-glucuronosyltransferase P-like [Vespula pensylvanica]XP_043671439.1 galactosylgalactosylxylosylprotein 3-beta-glucuronosyltransferase P-like [Vespula pensylvanica]XP_043671440.1 galactosylgalactosylxylosylprotein 3-beta-glucuronosyltransferase P-like [Vespula pensylvanica]XP_043671441.1 galactosylgalactosylxylosylprotein 3-beta-glucuronosyltr